MKTPLSLLFLPVLTLTFASLLPVAAQPVVPAAKTPKPKAQKKTVAVSGIAHIRVLHAVPGGPKVDVYAGTVELANKISYKSLSDYMDVKSGKTTFKVTVAGKTETLITDAASLTKDKFFTLAIAGKQAPTLVVVKDSTGADMPDKARVRVVHLAPGAPAVMITAPSTRAAAGYAKFIAQPLEFGKSASKSVKPMTAKLQVRGADGGLLKETDDLELVAGKRYDAFAIGEVGEAGANAFDVLVKPAGE